MKKLLLSVVLLVSCNSQPVTPEPQPAVAVGTQITTPCMVHGEDVWTVTGVERVFVYTIVNQDGVENKADEATVLQVIQENQNSVAPK